MLAPGKRCWAYLVAGFTEGPPILLVEALPGQLAATDTAREALGGYCLSMASTPSSRGDTVLWQKAQMSRVEETGCDPPSLGELYPVTTQDLVRVPGFFLKPPEAVSTASVHGEDHEGH